MREDQERRHAELLQQLGATNSPDPLQQLDHDGLVVFLQQNRCTCALAQVQRLRLNGYALASVVDGLGWDCSPSGDFLLAKWLAEKLTAATAMGVIDEMTVLHGACAALRAGQSSRG